MKLSRFTQKNPNRTKSPVLTHHFLVASPRITDGIFHQSLVYICQQDDMGVLGLIINKPLNNTVGKLFEELQIDVTHSDLHKMPPLDGGPLSPEVGFVLHTGQPTWLSSFAITENVCITTSKDILHGIALGQGVEHFLLCLGHASWAKGQLEAEINEGDWFVQPANLKLLFDTPFEQRWQQAGAVQGINFDILSTDIGHA